MLIALYLELYASSTYLIYTLRYIYFLYVSTSITLINLNYMTTRYEISIGASVSY